MTSAALTGSRARDPVEAVSHEVVFYGLLIGVCCHALARGGAPERVAAAAIVAATLLTNVAWIGHAMQFEGLETGILLVDVGLLAIFLALALAAERYWPIWMTGLQGASVACHLPIVINHQIRLAYAILVASWSFPILILLAAGAVRHRRRLATYGTDPSWRSFSRRSSRRAPADGPTG